MRYLSGSRVVLWITAIVVAVIGAGLAFFGGRLAALGGSWYYLAAGIGFLATAVMLMLRRREALWVYALVVLGTLAFAYAEIGLDWWPLAARGDVVFPVGLWLLLPWVRNALVRSPEAPRPRVFGMAGLPLVVALVLAGAVGVVAMSRDLTDRFGTLTSAANAAAPPANYGGVPDGEWHAYGRSDYGDRYSPLAEITPQNVANLKVAWTYNTGDMPRSGDPKETTFELTPLAVGNKVFICTPHSIAVALDAETGKEVWRYDPKIQVSPDLQHMTCRGVSYHAAPADASPPNGECPSRILLPTADARLIALDAETGKPCAGFGDNGTVNLWTGMPQYQPGFYYSTSPPVTTRNLVIIAGNVSDNVSTHEPSGVIRGYDINTGRLVWNFDPASPNDTAPIGEGKTYAHNSPNSWSISAADEQLGLIYLPMGNATPDQWGADRRPTDERFSSAILALEIATGRLRWVYQTVHHDLWDMDIGAQPSLVDLSVGGRPVPALIAPTKRGDLFVLDRRTGEPIVPAPEKPVPQGAVTGDRTSPTQPFSALTLAPEGRLTEADMWGATMFDQLACRLKFRSLRYDGIFTPPSLQGSLVYPGNFGVIDWGGIAIDPVRKIAFANPSYFAFYSRLIPRGPGGNAEGQSESHQSPAGGSDMKKADESGANPNHGAPYAVDMGPLVSPLGLPCQAPPWGYIAGIDLQTMKVVYKIKNGTVRDVAPVPLPFKMGVPSLGGPIVTAGGLAFLTSTLDYYVRAYDVANGKVLWQDRLPAGGQATPMSYRSPSGKQTLLVMAGGHGSLGTKQGDAIIAYRLP